MNRQSFLAGLVCGEGCFSYSMSQKQNFPKFRFTIQMHKRDYILLVLLSEELGVGNFTNLKSRPTMCGFEVTSQADNVEKVIPYFDGQLVGYKKAQFEMWKEKLLKHYAGRKKRRRIASAIRH